MQFSVTGQCIECLDIDKLVSGSVNLYEAEFTFDDTWEGYEITAVFQSTGNEPVSRTLVDGKCKVPYTDLFEDSGYLMVGVFGVKGEEETFVRKPTVYTDTMWIDKGCANGHVVPDPDPDIYEELLLRIAKVEREIQGLNGGETGEVLTKLSDDDDDYGWRKTTRSVNNKQGDVVLDAEDVDAVPEDNYLTNIEIEEIINSVA